MKKSLLIIPLIILLMVIFISLFSLYENNKSNVIVAQINLEHQKNFPEFSLVDLYDENSTFSNKDLKNKYSIINFFSSWCVSCKAEHDILINIAKYNKIDIYGVAWFDTDSSTKAYLEKNGNPYLKIGIDSKNTFSKSLSIKGIPETFIINPQGKIIYYQQGIIDDDFVNFVKLIIYP